MFDTDALRIAIILEVRYTQRRAHPLYRPAHDHMTREQWLWDKR